MRQKSDTYIPGLSHDWLTPLYDSLVGWTMPEYAFKLRLIEQARIKSNHFMLDLGCGTGTLKQLARYMTVFGTLSLFMARKVNI